MSLIRRVNSASEPLPGQDLRERLLLAELFLLLRELVSDLLFPAEPEFDLLPPD